MAEIQHLAMCTKNNRRLARFYHLIFGFEEVWNAFQNNPYAFYMSDGYLNLNCLQIHPGSSYNRIVGGKEIMPDDVMPSQHGDPGKFRYLKDPDGNIVELSEQGWGF